LINVWHDGEIRAGAEWAQEIKTHLNEAKIILLLISPDFIQSDYCYSTEMHRALERHQQRDARVIPVILRPITDWKKVPPGDIQLGQLQALPENAKPITTWKNPDEAWKEVAEGIEQVINELLRGSLMPQSTLLSSSLASVSIQKRVDQLPSVPDSGTNTPHALAQQKLMLPRRYYSCFISYSSQDQDFVERFCADLQSKGVHCWFASEDMKIGDKIRPRIDKSIRTYDKLLLILSKHSVTSPWVETEVEMAFERERQQNELVLFPVMIDETVMQTKQSWAADIRRTRHIGDLTHWKDRSSYDLAFTRLLHDLEPELHSPDQSEGDVADVPLFPNPLAEEERLRQGVALSRRTFVLGLGIAGLAVAGGVLTYLVSSLGHTHSSTPTPTLIPQPPKVIYIISDATNKGQNTGEAVSAVRASDGTTLWHTQWNNESSNTQPVVVDGVVYVATAHFSSQLADAGVVHALRASDGSTLWSYRVEHTTRGAPSVYIANGVAFVGAPGYQAIFALRASDGLLLWKYQVAMEYIALPQAVANGIVYAGSYDFRSSRGNAYAFRVSDGTMLWKYQMNLEVKGWPQSAVVDSGVVYIASPISYNRFTAGYDPTKDVQNTNSTVYALRASDGSLLWKYEIDKDSSFLNLKMIDGVLYATSGSQKNSNGIIYALQRGNGALLWKYQVHIDYTYYDGQVEAIITGGVVYIASQGDPTILYALKAKDGSLLWQYNLGNGFDPIIIPVNGVVYVSASAVSSSDFSSIDALRVNGGSLLWSYQLDSNSYISALIAARTTLYVGVFGGSGPGSMFTLQLSNGSLLQRSQGISVRFMTGGS
jgi:outer membrane protein assembly factor BamB